MTRTSIIKQFPALRFDQPWKLLLPSLNHDPKTSIGIDTELLQQVGRGEIGPCICIKQDPQCLVVTRRESRMEGFEQASKVLAAAGWPVVIRSSGGSCVPQGPGMLNLSLIYPRVKDWTLDDGYRLLCALCKQLIVSYGLNAETGEVPGSFCDGRYNLQIAHQKLVGTAQRWAGSNRKQAAILTHACLLVDLDLVEVTGRINQLYRLCHNSQQFDPNACTTLGHCLDPERQRSHSSFIAEVQKRLTKQVLESFSAQLISQF